MPISVIIPSYRNPDYLDLCLNSAIRGQREDNQIIVILDGFADESEHIVAKYKGIQVVRFEANEGQIRAHNTGVTLAENEAILIVNDDNVFPLNWDMRLNHAYDERKVISPNQIEPTPSIFKSFIIKDYGTSPETFQHYEFNVFQMDLEISSQRPEKFTKDGQTWPIYMSKKWYMILNGIDPYFPSPAVADWDFFMRCELAGLECVRYHACHFYHFSGAGTKKTPEMAAKHQAGERASFEYFQWKWGFAPTLDDNNNKRPAIGTFRGMKYE